MTTAIPRFARRASLLGMCVAGVVGQAQAQAPQQNTATPASSTLEEVIVTGFRQSLENSTEAKRDAVGFVDAIWTCFRRSCSRN
jgi:hypothetical protein